MLLCALLAFLWGGVASAQTVGAHTTYPTAVDPRLEEAAPRPAPPSAVQPSAEQPSAAQPSVEPTSPSDAEDATARPSDHPLAVGLEVPPVPEGFKTHDGGWIHFAYQPSSRARVETLKLAADKAREELREMLGQNVLERVHVRVGRTVTEMETLAPEGAGYPKYASGVAYSEIGLVLLTEQPRYPGERHDLVQIFRHELAHVALHDAVGHRNVPRWFNEGFAVHASGEAVTDRMQTLWTATLAGNLLPLADLAQRFPADATDASIAYAQAADVVRYLLRSHESYRFRALIERLRTGQDFEAALSDAYATDLSNLEYEWREDVARRYTFWPVLFSGSMVWMGALGLFVWGWRKRQKRNRKILARWAVEEAREDARRAEMANRPVHIVLARPSEGMPLPPGERISRPDIPKIEHDGNWHTLH